MSVVFAAKMQKELLESNEKLTVITAEPGAGSTTALLMKAWQVASDNQDVNVLSLCQHDITSIVQEVLKNTC